MGSEDPQGATTEAEGAHAAVGAEPSPAPDGANGSTPPADDGSVEVPGATAEPSSEEAPSSEPSNEGAPAPPARLWAVVMVFDIAVDLPTPHARLTLREVAEPNRLLVIPVGLPEGTALAHAWRGVATPRPLTHELFSDVLTRLGATIEVVRLTGRRAGVLLAEMELSSPRGREVVPCRPTDGVTLSVRQGVSAPILVDLRLFDGAGDVDPDG